MKPCCICGHVYSQKHRLVPGAWGGVYDAGNVVSLCPNHHVAIHLLMKWKYRGLETQDEKNCVAAYLTPSYDWKLYKFWKSTVQSIVISKLNKEGKRPCRPLRMKKSFTPNDPTEKIIGLLKNHGSLGMTRKQLHVALNGSISSSAINTSLRLIAEKGIARGIRSISYSKVGAIKPTEKWFVCE